MNISTLPISLYWQTVDTVQQAAEGRRCLGTCLATGERGRWERYDVLGEIKPEKMPEWAKEALTKLKVQQKEKKTHSREER